MSLAPRPILEAAGLTKVFKGPSTLFTKPKIVQAVDRISLRVWHGETLAIVGESGSGKSTLGRLLLQLLSATDGDVFYEGENLKQFSADQMKKLRRDLQIIFQDPFASLNPRMTVEEIVGEPLWLHNIVSGKADRQAKVRELLTTVGLPAAFSNRYPHEFSGGQRQRIGIARALAVEPDVIVADELVSALDVSVQAQVVNLLLQLQEKLQLTVVFVAHDLRLVRHISHRVAVMYLGQVMEVSPSEALFTSPRHPYSKALLDAAPELDPTRRDRTVATRGELPSPMNLPVGCPFASRCPHAFERCLAERPILTPRGNGQYAACHLTEFGAPEAALNV